MEQERRIKGEPRMVSTYEGWESDADAFEEGVVDASWIPDMYSWMSLGEFRSRINELEEYAEESLVRTDDMPDVAGD